MPHYEDDQHISGAVGEMPLAVRKDASGTLAGADNDYAPLQVDANGALRVTSSGTATVTSSAGPTTGTVTSVNDSATSVTLLAANTARLAATVFNDSTAVLFVKLGATASNTSFTNKVAVGGYYELPTVSGTNKVYSGIVDGIWATDEAGAARITELT